MKGAPANMFEQYTQKHNNELMKYPIIQKIATEKQWTISDKKKRPVDAVHLLATYEVRNARVLDDPYPLVSLHDINKDPNFDWTNRAYRLHAQNNRVIAVDVEPSASPEVKQFAKDFPSHFTEISKNGGVHLIIEVPEDLINDENRYLFETTVIKTPDGTMELILNDHYITFTKKIVGDKPIADFINNQSDREKLASFLKNMVIIDADAKERRELAKEIAVEFNNDNIHHDLIESLLSSPFFVNIINRQKEKSAESFNHDLSRYETSISTACAGQVYRFAVKTLPSTIALKQKYDIMTENDWIYMVYKMVQFIVPEREKHYEYRENLPWLLYVTKGSWTYIRSVEEQKNK